MVHDIDIDIHEHNRELTRVIAEMGERMGLEVRKEYAIPGGRLDVVWLWNPPSPIPGLAVAVPVVGFEIESSWRTRKHVKGDMVNLQDAGVALGVIVLSGADKRDEDLRVFARKLTNRPGTNILIWTDEDVRSLSAGEEVMTALETLDVEADLTHKNEMTDEVVNDFVGKYRPLWEWLRVQESSTMRVSFADIERIAGISLPNSSRAYVAHWHGYEGERCCSSNPRCWVEGQ